MAVLPRPTSSYLAKAGRTDVNPRIVGEIRPASYLVRPSTCAGARGRGRAHTRTHTRGFG